MTEQWVKEKLDDLTLMLLDYESNKTQEGLDCIYGLVQEIKAGAKSTGTIIGVGHSVFVEGDEVTVRKN